MGVNSLAPGFVKIKYGTAGNQSTMTLPVKPVSPQPGTFANQVDTADGTPATLSVIIDDFVALIVPFFGTDVSFGSAELWSKPLPESDPVFVEAINLDTNGTNAGTTDRTLQAVMTHRSSNGGLHRLYLIGIVGEPDVRDLAPFDSNAGQALSDYLISGSSFIFARDNGRLFAPIAFTTKTNDTLRKKRLDL